MATLEFYRRLDYDFSIYEGEESLRGLINEGFIGTESLCINEFNYLELNAARDVILCYLRPIAKINKNENSYSLKHIVEHIIAGDDFPFLNSESACGFFGKKSVTKFQIIIKKGASVIQRRATQSQLLRDHIQ